MDLIVITTNEARIAAARRLFSISDADIVDDDFDGLYSDLCKHCGDLTDVELDFAAALLLGKYVIHQKDLSSGPVLVQGAGSDSWEMFSPTSNWVSYGELITNVNFVISTGNISMDQATSGEIFETVYVSCHGDHGPSSTDEDARKAVAISAAKVLSYYALCGSAFTHKFEVMEENG